MLLLVCDRFQYVCLGCGSRGKNRCDHTTDGGEHQIGDQLATRSINNQPMTAWDQFYARLLTAYEMYHSSFRNHQSSLLSAPTSGDNQQP